MSPKRRKFRRPLGQRRYRKLFVIATEGMKTEPQYFAIFNNQESVVRVHCLKGRDGSSPNRVLKRMQTYLKQESLKSSDEAWLVVDKDEWSDEQLCALYEWSERKERYNFALSNPKFEYWLLLHFEDGGGIRSSRECSERLKRWLPDYDKGINVRKFTVDMITAAIQRAERRDHLCEDWPKETGTTVYRLIKSLMRECS